MHSLIDSYVHLSVHWIFHRSRSRSIPCDPSSAELTCAGRTSFKQTTARPDLGSHMRRAAITTSPPYTSASRRREFCRPVCPCLAVSCFLPPVKVPIGSKSLESIRPSQDVMPNFSVTLRLLFEYNFVPPSIFPPECVACKVPLSCPLTCNPIRKRCFHCCRFRNSRCTNNPLHPSLSIVLRLIIVLVCFFSTNRIRIIYND